MKFNYSLNHDDYSVTNALLWGNCYKHFQKAGEGRLGSRIIHVLIGIAELIPVIGQISSIFEMIIVTQFGDRPHVSTNPANSTSTQVPRVIASTGNATALEFNPALSTELAPLTEREVRAFLNHGGALNTVSEDKMSKKPITINSVKNIPFRLSEICTDIDMSKSKEIKLPYSEERVIKVRFIINDFRRINFQEDEKLIASYILIDLKVLKSICKKQEVSLNSFKSTIEHINALIYIFFRDDCEFNNSDVKYLKLAPRLTKFLRHVKSFAAFKHVSRCQALHSICIEESPLIFECLLQTALMHLYMASFSEMQNALGWIKRLNQESIVLLEDRITQLQHKTYTSMVAERELIATNVIPNLNKLFSTFENFVKENSSKEVQPSKDAQICLLRKIAQDKLLQSEEEKIVSYEQLLHTIKSISSILSTYNRGAFSSIMKLTLCTDQRLNVLRKLVVLNR